MMTPSENILAANCIVRSLKKPHDLYCAICTKDEYSDNWENHIKDPRHRMIMKRFDLIFDGYGSTTTLCKFCNERFAWDALKNHAEWHRILPWYKPDDLAKRFFDNYFFQWEKKFYCYLCDEIFIEWYTAFFHISDEKHYRAMRKKLNYEDFSLDDTNFSYETFNKNGLSSSGVSSVRCKICDCSSMAFVNIVQHIDGKKHNKLKNQLIDTLNKRNNDIIHKNEDLKKNSKIIEKTIKNKHENISDCDFIVKSLNNKLSCKICDIEFLDYSTVDKHLEGSIHASALKKYGCDNISLKKIDYHRCKSCNCFLTSIKDLCAHVKGKKHMRSINTSDKQNKKIEEEESSKSLVSISVSSEYEKIKILLGGMTCDWIVKLDDIFHLCKICNVKLTGPKVIEAHCTSKGHASALQKYGCFFIILIHDDYYCKCCECKISGAENVYLHIKGQRHEKSLNEFGCRYIVIQEGNFYCKCCKCKLTDLVNVFHHVKIKKHLSILKESKDETNSIKDNKSKIISINRNTESKKSIDSLTTTDEVKSSNDSKVKKARKSRKRIPKNLRLKIVPIVHTSCDLCNATVSGSVELHKHLALHFNEGFDAIINNNTTNKENEENERDINSSSSDDDDTDEYTESKNFSDISLNLLWRGFEESE